MGQPVPGNDTRRLPFSPQPACRGAQARERARGAPEQHGVDPPAHGLERILREVAVEAGLEMRTKHDDDTLAPVAPPPPRAPPRGPAPPRPGDDARPENAKAPR